MKKAHKNICCKFCGYLISPAFVDHQCGELFFVRWVADGADVWLTPVLGIFAESFELAARTYIVSNCELADLVFNHEYMAGLTVSNAQQVQCVVIGHVDGTLCKLDEWKSKEEPHPYFKKMNLKALDESIEKIAKNVEREYDNPVSDAEREAVRQMLITGKMPD